LREKRATVSGTLQGVGGYGLRHSGDLIIRELKGLFHQPIDEESPFSRRDGFLGDFPLISIEKNSVCRDP
jgi:hypothetical protein